MMIDHTSLGAKDYPRAVAFFSAALAPLGYALQRDTGAEAAFGTERDWGFFVYPVAPDATHIGEKTHYAFSAPSRAAVEAFNRACAEQRARTTRPPGPRPDISPEYFGTVLVDPEGHTLEAVFWDRA